MYSLFLAEIAENERTEVLWTKARLINWENIMEANKEYLKADQLDSNQFFLLRNKISRGCLIVDYFQFWWVFFFEHRPGKNIRNLKISLAEK